LERGVRRESNRTRLKREEQRERLYERVEEEVPPLLRV
jgi:hypothetical protein